MTRLSLVLGSGIILMLMTQGCGNRANFQDLATPPSSLSDGQPIAFAVAHPELVPVVACNGNDPGIVICHVPPGNPAAAHTICIGEPAVQHHLDHHPDYLGACGATSGGGGDTGGGGTTPTPSPTPTDSNGGGGGGTMPSPSPTPTDSNGGGTTTPSPTPAPSGAPSGSPSPSPSSNPMV